ncbi:hypothetical protein [Microvirga arsenatis]|uniref:Uncharacterized protein n=1 Tax=Microvirga arsenatis TaxID=2692265 RepID=A0ABW9Z8Y1_9HYPH|nr:hypothetical protein [Microvirga arsenatis]NBJ13622.1 hypothetical protein [Microvirga arsenatis]NBJ27094.1 hypothetical protein [Microvirga arsenatis]
MELLLIEAYSCRAGQFPDFGDAALDHRYARLTESLLGLPEEWACVVMRWRGGRCPSGIAIGGRRITAATGGRLFAGSTQIGVFTRTFDSGDEERSEHEMFVVVTNPKFLATLKREFPAKL